MTVRRSWTIHTLYEYDDWANESWYGNFDWEPDLLPGDQMRYLGRNKEYVDKLSSTNREYGERALRPRSVGWNKWLGDQMRRCVASTAGWMELDNQDYALKRDRGAVQEAFEKLLGLGIKPLLKNPTERDIGDFAAMAAGCIFESGTDIDGPQTFAKVRNAFLPSLRATFVRHGEGELEEAHALRREVMQVPGTSVQWGPREYNGMRILMANPAQ